MKFKAIFNKFLNYCLIKFFSKRVCLLFFTRVINVLKFKRTPLHCAWHADIPLLDILL